MPLRDASLPCATVSVRGLLREGGKQKSEKSTQTGDTKVAGREAGRQTEQARGRTVTARHL